MYVADLLGELHRRAAERIDRPAHLRQAEARVRRRGTDVGGKEQLDAASDTVAVDGGDDRLRVHVMLQEGVADDAGRFGRRGGSPLMSAPAQKALAPAPVRTTHRQLPRSSSSHNRARSAIIWRDIALQPRRVVDGEDHDVPAVLSDSDLHASRPGAQGRTTTFP